MGEMRLALSFHAWWHAASPHDTALLRSTMGAACSKLFSVGARAKGARCAVTQPVWCDRGRA